MIKKFVQKKTEFTGIRFDGTLEGVRSILNFVRNSQPQVTLVKVQVTMDVNETGGLYQMAFITSFENRQSYHQLLAYDLFVESNGVLVSITKDIAELMEVTETQESSNILTFPAVSGKVN